MSHHDAPFAPLPLDIMALILRAVEALRLTLSEKQVIVTMSSDDEQKLMAKCPQWSLAATCKAWRDAARDASAWTTLWVQATAARVLTLASIADRMSSPRFERVTTLIFLDVCDSYFCGSLTSFFERNSSFARQEFFARLAALPSLKALALPKNLLNSLGLQELFADFASSLGAKLEALSLPASASSLTSTPSFTPQAFTALRSLSLATTGARICRDHAHTPDNIRISFDHVSLIKRFPNLESLVLVPRASVHYIFSSQSRSIDIERVRAAIAQNDELLGKLETHDDQLSVATYTEASRHPCLALAAQSVAGPADWLNVVRGSD